MSDQTSAATTHSDDDAMWHVMDEAIRGFFFEKHLPFSLCDSWTDEVIAIVREHVENASSPTGADQ